MKYLFEVCANSVESCIAAQKGGAHRVELCSGILEGGTTPSYGEIITAREQLHIKLHVIIRPRGGDFLYTETEIQIMEKDIRMCRKAGVDGVVLGCLTSDGEIDTITTKRLINAAEGMSVTFHRAFDQCWDPAQALDQLIALGCHRILTSGQQPTAEQGLPLLKKLVKRAGNRIIILPGSGINEININHIAHETSATEFHFSARERRNSNMSYQCTSVPMNATTAPNQYQQDVTTEKRVKNTIAALKNHSMEKEQ